MGASMLCTGMRAWHDQLRSGHGPKADKTEERGGGDALGQSDLSAILMGSLKRILTQRETCQKVLIAFACNLARYRVGAYKPCRFNISAAEHTPQENANHFNIF